MKLEKMVQELWDRERSKELTYAYGLASRQDEERMANLFTEMARWTSFAGQRITKGGLALKEFYLGTWPLRCETIFH